METVQLIIGTIMIIVLGLFARTLFITIKAAINKNLSTKGARNSTQR